MPYKDKNIRLEYGRNYYRDNSEKKRELVRIRKMKIKQWFREYKSTLSCIICGESHPRCLDFHHTGPKKMNVSDMVRQGYSKESILKEINKCIVLCANCHRKKT